MTTQEVVTDPVQPAKAAGLPRPKILATIVRLMETTYIRVGNTEYAYS